MVVILGFWFCQSMATEGSGVFIRRKKGVAIEVDAAVAQDPAFPFKEGDDLRFRIEDGAIVIEKARRKVGTGRKRSPPGR